MTVFRGRVLAALIAGAALAAPLSAQELDVVERTLPNGMKVLMVPRHDQPTISCGWLARVGSANERPGITGLAQVRGRNALSWPEKFEFDVKYVEDFSLLLDAQILLETALKVVKREGISAGAHATMPEFMGNE